MACEHKRGRWIEGETCALTGEQLPGQWVEDFTCEDVHPGRYRCTQCGLIMYYTGHWRDYYEKGMACPGSDGVRREPPNAEVTGNAQR